MKSLIFFLFVKLVLVSCIYGQSPTPCLGVSGNCVGEGDAFIDQCFSGIQRQIARSVNADNLASWIKPSTCWGYIPINGQPYDVNNIPPASTPVNCIPAYDRCWGNYCPEKYCQIIKSFVNIRASIILRAAVQWGNDNEMKPGSPYFNAMEQMVLDINSTYDCAGIRRPVIQGGIFEDCNVGNASVSIPCEVIDVFRTDPDFDINYYLNGDGSCKSIFFTKTRINHNTGSWPNCPDITKIEAKMWFYYLSKLYVDLGFKSIHMGQMKLWSSNDVSLAHSTSIINKIRQYAISQNTFVLLTEENFRALKFPNSNTFMFDYDSRVLRPTEVPSAGSAFYCPTPTQNYLDNTPCSNEQYRAIIDECCITHLGNSYGNSPLNSCPLPYQPFNTYFDFGAGNYPPLGIATSTPDVSLWGWDDTKWFATKISTACREYWMGDAICRIRDYYNGFGFMTAPGMLVVKMPENYNNFNVGINPTADASYIMSDEGGVLETVLKKWTPANNITISTTIGCEPYGGYCEDRKKIKGYKKYSFSINNPDCSTFYTWHIKNPDNTWQPFTYGIKRSFVVTMDGQYTIYVRQDNLGSFNPLVFTEVKTDAYIMYLEKECCFNNDALLSDNEYEIQRDSLYNISEDSEWNKYISQSMSLDLNNSISKTTELALVPHINMKNAINVYPNPSSDLMNIEFIENFEELFINNIDIVDVLGRVVISKKIERNINKSTVVLDISSLKSGLYTLLISNKNYSHTEKFIKI